MEVGGPKATEGSVMVMEVGLEGQASRRGGRVTEQWRREPRRV